MAPWHRFKLHLDVDVYNHPFFENLSDKAFRTYVNVRLLMAMNNMADKHATCHISLVRHAAGSGRGSRRVVQELIDLEFIYVDEDGIVTFSEDAEAMSIQPASRKREAIPTHIRERVYARDGHRCLICGTTKRLTLDHITPFSHGGEDTEDNLRTLCLNCNVKRGAARLTDEELRSI